MYNKVKIISIISIVNALAKFKNFNVNKIILNDSNMR